ncbi:MAG: NUDIX hydrolase [bacterium]|nr:NUDIX hydrolase [bacterium]
MAISPSLPALFIGVMKKATTMQETILHSQAIYDGKIVHLSVLDVRLPDGKTAKRELVTHSGAVAIVALDEQQRVLLVRQYRIAANQVLTEVPAGTLNPGEDPLTCAVREMQEETRYKPGKIEPLGGIFVAPGYTTEFIHLFLASDLQESALAMDDDEFIELDRVPFSEAIAMIERGDIRDGKSVAGILRAARKLGL